MRLENELTLFTLAVAVVVSEPVRGGADHGAHEIDFGEDVYAHLVVALDDCVLVGGEAAGLVENLFGDRQLPHIVH